MEVLTRSYSDEHGSIQKYQDSDGNIAVIDTDGEFVTINWSTSVRATEFWHNVRSLQHLNDSYITLGLRGEKLQEIDYGVLTASKFDSERFDHSCNFLRLDLSETRTFEWQSLLTPDQIPLTGLGDSVAAFHEGKLQAVLYDFIVKTARTDTLIDPIMKSLERLDLL